MAARARDRLPVTLDSPSAGPEGPTRDDPPVPATAPPSELIPQQRKKSDLESTDLDELLEVARLLLASPERLRLRQELELYQHEVIREWIARQFYPQKKFTSDEIRILELAADGYTDKQIAQAIEKSITTVKNRLTRIGGKIFGDDLQGAERDRVRIVAEAIRRKIIP